MKKCEVHANGEKYTADFYGVFQLSTVIDPSPMIGGHPGGVIAYPVAVVDFGDGDGLINLPIEEIARVYEAKEKTNIKVVFKDNRESIFDANVFGFEDDGYCYLDYVDDEDNGKLVACIPLFEVKYLNFVEVEE